MNMTCGLDRNDSSILKNVIPMNARATISVMLPCEFVCTQVLLHFEGWLEIFVKLEYFLMHIIKG